MERAQERQEASGSDLTGEGSAGGGCVPLPCVYRRRHCASSAIQVKAERSFRAAGAAECGAYSPGGGANTPLRSSSHTAIIKFLLFSGTSSHGTADSRRVW